MNFDQLSLADFAVYSSIPPHPFWDEVDKVVDFSFADELCAPLYSPNGRRPYPPSLKLKVHLVQRYYNISDREMELKVIGDIFVKRFLGLPVSHAKFDHSTIALDRSRLGAEMFRACHNHILAQALAYGLWGDEDDRWLVDSFHTYARVAKHDTYELIRRAILKVIRHMKRNNPAMYAELKAQRSVGDMLKKMDSKEEEKLRNLRLSSLVVHAYWLLVWTKRQDEEGVFPWPSPEAHTTHKDLTALLHRVLQENIQRVDDKDADSGSGTDSGAPDESAKYRELPKDKKPADRIVSVDTPDVRAGTKSKSVQFIGDKIQVVESSKSKLILNVEPIPGNEGDGERLIEVVRQVIDEHKVRPQQIVADSAYGSGENRYRVRNELHTSLVAPVPQYRNNPDLFLKEEFKYDEETKHVVCPAGKKSYRSQYNNQLRGTQFFFHKDDCNNCPLRAKCTDSKGARTIFLGDHWKLVQEGKQYNATEAGQAALQSRREIERSNNEMKNHHGLKSPRTHGRKALRIDALITAMTVNLKVIVRTLRARSAQNALTTA